MDRSLLYISRKTIPLETDKAEIANILATARVHNAKVGITGGLINTNYAFAQLLEGPGEAIDDLMERIEDDPRHVNVQILRYYPITRRKLPDWSMAYSGPSSYVANRIEPLLGKDLEPDHRQIDRLAAMLVQFASAHDDPAELAEARGEPPPAWS